MANKSYKFKNHQMFVMAVKKYGRIKDFSDKSTIPLNAMTRYLNNSEVTINKENVIKITSTLDIPVDVLFEDYAMRYKTRNTNPANNNTQDKSNLIISEEIICGLKKNIQDRLSICHSRVYVNEIMKTIDELVIESSYLGVNVKEVNKEEFIVSAITKRRSEK